MRAQEALLVSSYRRVPRDKARAGKMRCGPASDGPGFRPSSGMCNWRSSGAARSGSDRQQQEPDSAGGVVEAAHRAASRPPKGRYVQVRTRFAKDPAATFGELRLHFVTDNVRAVLTSLSAEGRAQRSGKLQQGLLASGAKITKSSPNVQIKWDIDNPDKDELRYRINYRLDARKSGVRAQAERGSRQRLRWETPRCPRVSIAIRVEASESCEPPDRPPSTRTSRARVVDNTPHVFKSVGINGRR